MSVDQMEAPAQHGYANNYRHKRLDNNEPPTVPKFEHPMFAAHEQSHSLHSLKCKYRGHLRGTPGKSQLAFTVQPHELEPPISNTYNTQHSAYYRSEYPKNTQQCLDIKLR